MRRTSTRSPVTRWASRMTWLLLTALTRKLSDRGEVAADVLRDGGERAVVAVADGEVDAAEPVAPVVEEIDGGGLGDEAASGAEGIGIEADEPRSAELIPDEIGEVVGGATARKVSQARPLLHDAWADLVRIPAAVDAARELVAVGVVFPDRRSGRLRGAYRDERIERVEVPLEPLEPPRRELHQRPHPVQQRALTAVVGADERMQRRQRRAHVAQAAVVPGAEGVES